MISILAIPITLALYWWFKQIWDEIERNEGLNRPKGKT